MDPEPPQDPSPPRPVNWWGLFLIVLGVGWLGGMLGWYHFNWSWAGPIALIAVGCCMVFGRGRRRRC